MSLPPFFELRQGVVHCERVSLEDIVKDVGSPVYVYSRAALKANLAAYQDALVGREALVCYAVKANSNLAVLNCMAHDGAGFDIVSGGELERVIAAGGEAGRTIFSGVGKTAAEMARALELGIYCFNVESTEELHRLNDVAASMGMPAPVSLRVNPDVDPKTHPYISTGLKASKFGIAYSEAAAVYRLAHKLPHLKVIGIDCHIGSQLLDDAPLLEALERLIQLVDTLDGEGIKLSHLDLGGGVGIQYEKEVPVQIDAYMRRVTARIDAWRALRHGGKPIRLLFEPGRSIVGNAGVLVTRVEYLKAQETRNFAIVDAAMNDLMRPAMYGAWHEVVPVRPGDAEAKIWEVVGPICESGDWLAHERELAIESGDLLAFLCAGAYAMTMASNYNTRPRVAEVMVDGERFTVVRERETVSSLFALERVLDEGLD